MGDSGAGTDTPSAPAPEGWGALWEGSPFAWDSAMAWGGRGKAECEIGEKSIELFATMTQKLTSVASNGLDIVWSRAEG